jgi:hypothetical protein
VTKTDVDVIGHDLKARPREFGVEAIGVVRSGGCMLSQVYRLRKRAARVLAVIAASA